MCGVTRTIAYDKKILKKGCLSMENIDNNEVEVDFVTYCQRCTYEKEKETEEPCTICMESPLNDGTSKPILFKERH